MHHDNNATYFSIGKSLSSDSDVRVRPKNNETLASSPSFKCQEWSIVESYLLLHQQVHQSLYHFYFCILFFIMILSCFIILFTFFYLSFLHPSTKNWMAFKHFFFPVSACLLLFYLLLEKVRNDFVCLLCVRKIMSCI